MKLKSIIISILLISFFLVLALLIGYKIKSPSSYTLEEIKRDYPIINHPREAIEVLKQNNQINYAYLKEIESDANFEIGWKFYVSQNKNVWSVDLSTVGVIPPHICSYEMDKNGNPTHDEYLTECRWIGK